ncbi:HAD-IA family hydrolase [Streptococcus suis]|nr:HAD-IA family hydrolase [Streptococcus suis]
MKPTFIWDLDGTLLDSYEAILVGIEETYAQFNIPFEREAVKNFILRYSVKDLLVRDAKAYGQSLSELNRVRATSLREKNTAISLLDGAREILEWTDEHDIQNFIYTHKSDNAFKVLAELGIDHYFIEILTSESGFARKPNPEALLYLIEKYQLDCATTFYVGDRLLDVETALAAGIQSINLQIDNIEQNIKISRLTDIRQMFDAKNK